MAGTMSCDVVIVGAGASGLTAATHLKAGGLSVCVLEARDRVGGRLFTDTIEGHMLEIGGEWVSPDQDALKDMIAELGLQTYSRYREGASIYINKAGERVRFTGDIFPVPPETEQVMVKLIKQIDEMVAKMDPDRPWAFPNAKALDEISFDRWLRQQTDNEEAVLNIGLFIGPAMLTKPNHAFSMLQALHFAAGAGSFSNLVDADFILDQRVIGGLSKVPEVLAERLGADVHLNQPVRRLLHGDGGVKVITQSGLEVKARFVILAVPPNLINRITYEPPLSRRMHQLYEHISMGFVIKVHAVYETPFWRDDGLSGTAFSPYQICHEAYDNTNYGDKEGALVGFVSDANADEVFKVSKEERKSIILNSMATYFGPKALNPKIYYESDWGVEEWTRGAYGVSFDLGGMVRYGEDLGKPYGPIYFSCSDLAGKGFQHVDGAIRVGKATASAILDAAKVGSRPSSL